MTLSEHSSNLPRRETARALPRVATTLYTFPERGFVQALAVLHYGHEPLFVRGYAGNTYGLGDTLRSLLARGGRDVEAVAP